MAALARDWAFLPLAKHAQGAEAILLGLATAGMVLPKKKQKKTPTHESNSSFSLKRLLRSVRFRGLEF